MEVIATDIVGLFKATHTILEVFAFVVALFLLLSGLDDLAVDLLYWFSALFRRKQLNWFRHIPAEELKALPEKSIAMFIPTWHEQDVIEQMLSRTCQTLEYANYDIFVGVYPNDPATVEEVGRVARRYPQVHPVMAQHQGPSTKAQNLNDIHEGMIRWETITGIRYDLIVLHDAEDVVHPLSLKTFNYFVPAYDMVQIPVYPLPTPQRRLVHWTYADEFAENHTKDLVVRQMISPFVPSAGVGTAYNRWLIEFLGTSYARNMFSRKTLTEDYDIAMRLALGQARLLYLYKPFGLNVATWAFFPQTFGTAVRQRTRWLIGICLQAWRSYGWIGTGRVRMTLYRDRKAILTNIVNAMAYLVLIYVLLYELAAWGLRPYGELPPLVLKGTLLWYFVLADTGLMLWRFLHRSLAVSRVYGPPAGLLSIFRLPLCNILNFTATLRAVAQFLETTAKNRDIPWDKTAHTFPAPAAGETARDTRRESTIHKRRARQARAVRETADRQQE